jgi:hypothetical protein
MQKVTPECRTKYKVTIPPGFSVAVTEIRGLHPSLIWPWFCHSFLFFKFYSVFLIVSCKLETCLDILRDLPKEDVATVLRMVQKIIQKYIRYKNVCKMCIILIVTSVLCPSPDKPSQFAKVRVSERKVSVTLLCIMLLCWFWNKFNMWLITFNFWTILCTFHILRYIIIL